MSGVNSLTDFDANTIMTNALQPYDKIHICILPALVKNYKNLQAHSLS